MVLIIATDIGKGNDPGNLFDEVVHDPAMTMLKAAMRDDREWNKVRDINKALIIIISS